MFQIKKKAHPQYAIANEKVNLTLSENHDLTS